MENEIKHIKIADIYPDHKLNCREDSPDALSTMSLAKNIAENGLLAPIVVHPYAGPEDEHYRIVCGYRRYTACKGLQMESIPCVVRNFLSDEEIRLANISENLERKSITVAEEAEAIKPLYYSGWSKKQISDKLGRSVGWVDTRMLLLDLPQEIRDGFVKDSLPLSRVKEIAKLKNIELKFAAFRRLKDAKSRGKVSKARILKRKRKITEKKRRDVTDLDFMREEVEKAVGRGLATRLLAWAAGRATDEVILIELLKSSKRVRRPYTIPRDYKLSQDEFQIEET